MTFLALNLCGAPHRAMVVMPDGAASLVRLQPDAQGDPWSLPNTVWLDQSGLEFGGLGVRLAARKADGFLFGIRLQALSEARLTLGQEETAWSGRDFVAGFIRRVLCCAEQQAGTKIRAAHILVPSGLDDAQLRAIRAAAGLAGLAHVVVHDAQALMRRRLRDRPSGLRLTLDIWNDNARLTLDEARHGSAMPKVVDLSPTYAGAAIAKALAVRALRGTDEASRRVERMVDVLCDAWSSGIGRARGVTLSEPAPDGGPDLTIVTPTMFGAMERAIGIAVHDAVRGLGFDAGDVADVLLAGDAAAPLREVMARVFVNARIDDERPDTSSLRAFADAWLEDAGRLGGAIVAEASVHGGQVIELLAEGRALPCLVTHESFPFGAFFEFVAISQSIPGSNAMALCRIPVPMFAEGGRNIRELSLRVLADNKDLVIVEIEAPELGFSDLVIGHKTARTSASVPAEVVAMIRAVGTPG